MKFDIGDFVGTPGSIEALKESGQTPYEFLRRHANGDWGDLDDEDKALNDEALIDGSRIMSAYELNNGSKIWIITEAEDEDGDRAATTILLPEEY